MKTQHEAPDPPGSAAATPSEPFLTTATEVGELTTRTLERCKGSFYRFLHRRVSARRL